MSVKKLYYPFMDALLLGILLILFLRFNPNINTISQRESYTFILLWVFSPVLSFYLLMRILRVGGLTAFFTSAVTLYILTSIHRKKEALTNISMSFSDLMETNSFAIAIKYISIKEIIIISIFSLLLVLFFCLERFLKKKISLRKNKLYFLLLICLFIFSSSLALFPIISQKYSDNNFIARLHKIYIKLGINYNSSNWGNNVINNGLPYHLVQTSIRKVVPVSTEIEYRKFLDMKNDISSINEETPRNIIFILCESCWYSEELFKEKFTPIINQGFQEARMISPVYGGGTANAEFEVLTGLPASSGVLSGVLYQEYAISFRKDSLTLPFYFKKNGYYPYAAHNYSQNFFNRHVVFDKFGFERYDGIEKMEPVPLSQQIARYDWQWQYDDWSLYNQAINFLVNHKDQKNFLHLLTLSTHGGHPYQNDLGEASYMHQLDGAMKRLLFFIQQLEAIDPDAIIIIYGDHKPGLTDFFYSNNIFPEDLFINLRESDGHLRFKNDDYSQKIIGDVPVLIKGGSKAHDLANNLNNKPLFCLPVIFDDVITKINMPITQYALERCNNIDKTFNYKKLSESYEPWIYSSLLFK